MSEPTRSEALSEIFRQEALDHRNRALMRQGDPLRLSSVRLQWSTWGIVGLLAAGLALAGNLQIDQFASGPAVVRFDSGGAPASCFVVGYLPASQVSAIRPGDTIRFLPTVPAGTVAEIKLERVELRPLPTESVRRLLNDPGLPTGGEAMVAVAGRLDPCSFMNDGQRVEGSIEVRLQRRKLISALVPGSSVSSGSVR